MKTISGFQDRNSTIWQNASSCQTLKIKVAVSLIIFHDLFYNPCLFTAPRPWPQASTGFGPSNKFTLELGDSGGMRGYTGITGKLPISIDVVYSKNG